MSKCKYFVEVEQYGLNSQFSLNKGEISLNSVKELILFAVKSIHLNLFCGVLAYFSALDK